MVVVVRCACLPLLLALLLLGTPYTARAQSNCAQSPGSPDPHLQTISNTLTDAVQQDDGWSWGRFGWGLVKGAVIGAAVGAVAAAIVATAPVWLTVTLAVGAVGAAGYGIYKTYQNWGEMSGGDKSQLAGELIGGIFTGGLSARATHGAIQAARSTTFASTGAADSFLASRGVTTNVANRAFTLGDDAGEVLVHLTDEAGAAAINESGALFGRWGIFAFDVASVPRTALGKYAISGVSPASAPGGLSLTHGVLIPRQAAAHFTRPPAFGPFSLVRRAGGVRNSPAGTVLSDGTFLRGRIFDPATRSFRNMSLREQAWARGHQYMLDYGFDGAVYTEAGMIVFGDFGGD